MLFKLRFTFLDFLLINIVLECVPQCIRVITVLTVSSSSSSFALFLSNNYFNNIIVVNVKVTVYLTDAVQHATSDYHGRNVFSSVVESLQKATPSDFSKFQTLFLPSRLPRIMTG